VTTSFRSPWLSRSRHCFIGGHRRSSGLICVSAGAVTLAVGSAGLLSGTALGGGLAIATLFGLSVIYLISTERRQWGTIGLGSPLSLMAIFWFVYFGLLGLGALDDASRNPLLGSNPWAIVFAVCVVFIALLLVAVGFFLVTRALGLDGHSVPHGGSLALGGLIVTLLLGWLARLYLFQAGRFGYLSGGTVSSGLGNRLVQLGAALLTLSLVILVIAGWAQTGLSGLRARTAKWIFALNIVPLGLTAVASGLKGQLITDLVPAGVAFLMLRGRVPWRAVAVAVTYLAVILPGVQIYRDDLNSGAIAPEDRTGVVNATINATSRVLFGWVGAHPSDYIGGGLWKHLTREYSGMSRNLAIIIHRTPSEIPHLGNSRLVSEPLFFLPGDLIGRDDFNVYVYTNTTYLKGPETSASPPTQPGDFYMSGGWSTVIVGQFVVGLFSGLIWRLLVIRRKSAAAIAVYAVLAGTFVSAGVEWGTLSRSMLQAAVVLVPVSRLLIRPPPIALQEPVG